MSKKPPRKSTAKEACESVTRFTTSRRGILTAAATTGIAATIGGTALAKQSPAAVTFDNQKTDGKTVSVESVTLPKGGFIAIHDKRLLQGKKLKSVVGVSNYMSAGTHENTEITLFDVKGRKFKSGKKLKTDQPLIAMPHHDTNGNHEYDFDYTDGKTDGPYKKQGKVVIDKAHITVQSGSKQSPSVMFEDQRSSGKAVTVKSSTLPDGGFVAIHDKRLLEGKKLQSVVGVSGYLDPGTHEDIEVTLFNVKGRDFSASRQLKSDQPLIAMPHHDTNGNQEYDFDYTKGKADGPYRKNGEVLVDKAQITVTNC